MFIKPGDGDSQSAAAVVIGAGLCPGVTCSARCCLDQCQCGSL